jgi:ribosomal protein S16
MVRIRLRRVGATKQPSYRLVAADRESPRDGRFLEILGFYNPRTRPETIVLHEDRIYDWMKRVLNLVILSCDCSRPQACWGVTALPSRVRHWNLC